MYAWAEKTTMKIRTVTYDCIGCGGSCVTTNHNLRYRKHHNNEYYCQRCLIKLEKSSEVFYALPPQFHNQVFAGKVDHSLAVKYLRNVRSNINVEFCCKRCSRRQIIRWNKLLARKNNKFDSICYTCLQRKLNSTDEAIAKHRERSKSLWKDAVYRTACLRAFQHHNNKMQHDVEYAAKHKRRSRSISGEVKIGNRSLRFDSAYELMFIDHIYDRCVILRRCEYAIAYGKHFYHPDFFIMLPCGSRVIAEIKGYYRTNVEEKQRAAVEYIKKTAIADEYVLYDTNRLLNDGVLDGVGGGKMWDQLRRICNARTVCFASRKHQTIAKIGRSRYYKQIKNNKIDES
jgi:hypothetical protein